MKKKWEIGHIILIEISILLLCFIIIPLALYFYGRFSYSEKKAYEVNWGIYLPEHMKLIDDNREVSFHGDGYQYTVYRIKESINVENYKTSKNIKIEDECTEVADAFKETSKKYPDFTEKYMWKRYKNNGNLLVIIYFEDIKELHLFQKMI